MSWGVEHLEVRRRGRVVLSGANLAAAEGSVVGVVGGDGAGKTTLLRALAGALAPSGGRVRRPPSERIGFVSSGPGLWRDLTVAENLAFSAAAYGLVGAPFRGRAAALLARTRLGDATHRTAATLSGGMRQKLALAMALLHEPDLLVLDEPTTGVDPLSRVELWSLIAFAAAGGAAVVLATTYLDEAERAASLLVLHEGRPLAQGTPDALRAAVPGILLDAPSAGEAWRSWRRGSRWRVWSPSGTVVDGGSPVAPDLEDALVVAELAADAEREHAGAVREAV